MSASTAFATAKPTWTRYEKAVRLILCRKMSAADKEAMRAAYDDDMTAGSFAVQLLARTPTAELPLAPAIELVGGTFMSIYRRTTDETKKDFCRLCDRRITRIVRALRAHAHMHVRNGTLESVSITLNDVQEIVGYRTPQTPAAYVEWRHPSYPRLVEWRPLCASLRATASEALADARRQNPQSELRVQELPAKVTT